MEKVLYDEYVSKIKDCLDYYEENRINDKFYNIDIQDFQISYAIFQYMLPHLLGLDISF